MTTLTGTTVSEASPYVVFSVSGVAGQQVTLALSSGTAIVGSDTGTQLQYYNGTSWVDYTASSLVTLPAGGPSQSAPALGSGSGVSSLSSR